LALFKGEKKNISSCAHKTLSWYLFGVLFEISDEHPHHFYLGGLRDWLEGQVLIG